MSDLVVAFGQSVLIWSRFKAVDGTDTQPATQLAWVRSPGTDDELTLTAEYVADPEWPPGSAESGPRYEALVQTMDGRPGTWWYGWIGETGEIHPAGEDYFVVRKTKHVGDFDL